MLPPVSYVRRVDLPARPLSARRFNARSFTTTTTLRASGRLAFNRPHSPSPLLCVRPFHAGVCVLIRLTPHRFELTFRIRPHLLRGLHYHRHPPFPSVRALACPRFSSPHLGPHGPVSLLRMNWHTAGTLFSRALLDTLLWPRSQTTGFVRTWLALYAPFALLAPPLCTLRPFHELFVALSVYLPTPCLSLPTIVLFFGDRVPYFVPEHRHLATRRCRLPAGSAFGSTATRPAMATRGLSGR